MQLSDGGVEAKSTRINGFHFAEEETGSMWLVDWSTDTIDARRVTRATGLLYSVESTSPAKVIQSNRK